MFNKCEWLLILILYFFQFLLKYLEIRTQLISLLVFAVLRNFHLWGANPGYRNQTIKILNMTLPSDLKKFQKLGILNGQIRENCLPLQTSKIFMG